MKRTLVFIPVPKYDGYYWNKESNTLYSTKNNNLTELKRCKPTVFNRFFDGYVVSVKGRRRKLFTEHLVLLTKPIVRLDGYTVDHFGEDLFTI